MAEATGNNFPSEDSENDDLRDRIQEVVLEFPGYGHRNHNILISMSLKGNPYDNASAEKFIKRLFAVPCGSPQVTECDLKQGSKIAVLSIRYLLKWD
jgi:transposase InsO family protein